MQLFDSWAGVLSRDQYIEFALPYIAKICDAVDNVPKTVFAKGAYYVRKELGMLNCETIGLDWNMDIDESRKLIGNNVTLQGNLDPCLLYSDKVTIKEATKKMLNTFGSSRHIANLGHGLYPDTDPDHVKYFIETVKQHKF